MIRVYSFISVFLLLSLSACETTKEANTANELQPKENVRQAIISSEPGVYRSADPIGILEAVLKGDKLYIDVQYSGGCNAHEFTLVGAQMISKSMPPIRSMKLVHDKNNDDCRELIKETLVFNIRNLAYQNQTTVLKLENYPNDITYTPVK